MLFSFCSKEFSNTIKPKHQANNISVIISKDQFQAKTKMKIMLPPTKFGHTETLFTSLFQLSPVKGAQKPLFANSASWGLQICNGSKGLVRLATEDYVKEAIRAVRAGKVIAVPTDTLYGFACDACSTEAVQRIYEIKGRKHTKPLAVCAGDVQDIHRFAVTSHLPHGLLDSLLPGPVTVVLRRGESSILEKSLNPGLHNIGVRVPDYNFIRAIARGSGSALALTSANLSGLPSSVDVKDFENLWEHCEYIYDGGVLPAGRAGSTVVDLTEPGKYKILRPGSAMDETVVILQRHALVEDSEAS